MNSESLKQIAIEFGFTTAGVCSADPPQSMQAYDEWLRKGYHASMDYMERHRDLRSDLHTLLPNVRSVLAVSLNYHQRNARVAGEAHVAQYALGRDYHKVIRAKLNKVIAAAQRLAPDAAFRACVDSAPVLEREYAMRAGLGWYGKNTMLIDSRRGSWFFIGLILTDLELQSDAPSIGGCGSCTACIDACPTGAIEFDGKRGSINSNRCVSYLTIEHDGPIQPELAAKMGPWVFGCDVCQEVCPFNQERESQPLRAQKTDVADFEKRHLPPAQEMIEWSQADWDSHTKGRALRRAGYEGLLRNLRISIENESSG